MDHPAIPLYAVPHKIAGRKALEVTFTRVPGSRLCAFLIAPSGSYLEGSLLFIPGRPDGMPPDYAEMLAMGGMAGLSLVMTKALH